MNGTVLIAAAYWRNIEWDTVRELIMFVVICYVMFWIPLRYIVNMLSKIIDIQHKEQQTQIGNFDELDGEGRG